MGKHVKELIVRKLQNKRGGSTARNTIAQIATAQHFFGKYQVLNSKMSIAVN